MDPSMDVRYVKNSEDTYSTNWIQKNSLTNESRQRVYPIEQPQVDIAKVIDAYTRELRAGEGRSAQTEDDQNDVASLEEGVDLWTWWLISDLFNNCVNGFTLVFSLWFHTSLEDFLIFKCFTEIIEYVSRSS